MKLTYHERIKQANDWNDRTIKKVCFGSCLADLIEAFQSKEDVLEICLEGLSLLPHPGYQKEQIEKMITKEIDFAFFQWRRKKESEKWMHQMAGEEILQQINWNE